MSISTNESPIVAIAQKRSFEVNGQFIKRHTPLVRRLDDYEIGAVALNGAEDHLGDGMFSRHYEFGKDQHTLTSSNEPVHVDAALDITGGIAKYAPDVSALNPLGVRNIVLSKQAQFETLRPDLGEAVPETAIAKATSESVMATIDQMTAHSFIVKPANAFQEKRAMPVGTRDQIALKIDDFLKDMDPEKDAVIVQELMPEIRSDFAKGLRFFDNSEREKADSARNTNLELRVLMSDETPKLVTGRLAADPEKDNRGRIVYFDQNSIPSHVYDLATKAARLIRLRADAVDSVLAVDLTPDGSRIVEVNGRNIGTIRPIAGHEATNHASKIMTDTTAQKLAQMAHNKRGA